MASMDDLPACIVSCIMLLLSLRDAVRTSVLSRKWHAVWTAMERYELHASSVPAHLADRDAVFAGLVDRVVFDHSGPGIKVMSLAHPLYDVDGERVTAWLDCLASGEHQLEKLDVDMGAAVHTPASLFRCSTLVDLRVVVHAMTRGLDSATSLPLLRRLCLEHTEFRSSAQFQGLIDGCPLLETLHLSYTVIARADDPVGINIGGQALRRVVFHGCAGYATVPFEVSAPNVEEVVFSGRNIVTVERDGIRRLAARKVSLLLDDKLWAYRLFAPFHLAFPNVGTNMTRIMSGFHGVVELSLSGWCLEYLSRIVDNITLPEWKQLEILAVEGMWPNRGQAGVVLHLLRRYRWLKDLSITNELEHLVEISTDAQRHQYPNTPEFLFNPVPGGLGQLRRFTMRNFTADINETRIIDFVRGSSYLDTDQFTVTDASGQDWSGIQFD